MNKFFPKMYAKDIYSVNYNKLKQKGINILLFDFDNTLIERGNYEIDNKAVVLMNKLKKKFKIYVVTNSIHKKKLKKVCSKLKVPYIGGSRKPFKKGFKKLKLSNPKEVAMIGDQLLTDVLGGNKMNYYTVLIDPINYDEFITTRINRIVESKKLKKMNIKRGSYYD